MFALPSRLLSTHIRNAPDEPSISGLPHGAVYHGAASTHARHRPPEKSARVATITLPHGLILVSLEDLRADSLPGLALVLVR